jgi:hypothetical protein
VSRAGLRAAALAFLPALACHLPDASIPETASERHIPVWQLSEDQDEWLHDHCAYRGLGAGAADAPTGRTQAADANVGEVLYVHDGAAQLAVFACRIPPPFIEGGLVSAGLQPTPGPPAAAELSSAPVSDSRVLPAPAAAESLPPMASVSPAPVAVVPTDAPPRGLWTAAPRTYRPLAPYGTAALIVGAVGLGAGTVTGLMTMSAANEVHAHCDANRVCDGQGLDAASRGAGLATASTACFVGGGVLVAAGVALLALPGTPVKVGPAPQGLGMRLEGAF